MMEANPRLFEASVAGAAEACSVPQARFRLTRAVFRRFPGRYRQRMLEVGREVLASGEVPPEVAVWLVRKFGAELVPDLVGYVRYPGGGAERLDILHEAVKVLGLGADPVLQAALGSGCEELEEAAREALRRMGARLPEDDRKPELLGAEPSDVLVVASPGWILWGPGPAGGSLVQGAPGWARIAAPASRVMRVSSGKRPRTMITARQIKRPARNRQGTTRAEVWSWGAPK